MKRLMLALLVGLLAIPIYTTTAYGSSDQAWVTATGSYQTVDTHRYHRYYREDYDGPVVREYDYYTPEYNYYPYPYTTYYYEPGIGVDVPFFHFHIY